MGNASLLGQITDDTKSKLGRNLVDSRSRFGVYRRIFDEAGISPGLLESADPLDILLSLPLLEPDVYLELADEAVRTGRRLVDLETSSGSTGPRKRRAISLEDENSETRFLAELLGRCRIGEWDNVACLDTGPLTLMVSFARAAELLGVREAYAYTVGIGDDGGIEALARLRPTVIVTIPSILERWALAYEEHFVDRGPGSLTMIIYAGEGLSNDTRSWLEDRLAVEVFGYYGAAETSALGMECAYHDGIHLDGSRNIFEMVPTSGEDADGELAVTTLCQEALPLFRYALKDRIRIRRGLCGCGLDYPRVDVLGRVDDAVSVLGSKLSYEGVRNAVYRGADAPGPQQVVIDRVAGERMTVVLPEDMRAEESKLRLRLMDMEQDLGYLVSAGYMGLRFQFEERSYFEGSRKRPARMVDLRQKTAGDPDDGRVPAANRVPLAAGDR